MRERGLLFAGIDVIGDWLTEINVTSPTGIRAVKNLGGPDAAVLIWDKIEEMRKHRSERDRRHRPAPAPRRVRSSHTVPRRAQASSPVALTVLLDRAVDHGRPV